MLAQNKSLKWIVSAVLLSALVIVALALAAGMADAAPETLKFDVAEDMTRFAFDQTKTYEDGFPAHGSSFITEGYIYEYGTLSATNGVLPDGSPEFPDKVIGTWVCRGWFVGDAGHATEGVWVVTTQVYNFGEAYGRATIISEGYESAAVGEALPRAITGGTGSYIGATGEAYQTLLGFNEGTEGVNLRFELELDKKARPDR